jgi:hypothetical protein
MAGNRPGIGRGHRARSPSTPLGLISLTCNEIQHLFAAFVAALVANIAYWLGWSVWRRRTRTCHYRQQAAQQACGDRGGRQAQQEHPAAELRRDGRRHSWVAGRSDLMSPGMGHVVTNVAGPSTQRARSRRSSWCSSSRRRIGGLSTRTRTGRAAVRRRRARAHRPADGRPLGAYQTHRKSSQ